MQPTSPNPVYREHLWPGPSGWLIAVLISGMVAVAFWPISPVVGIVALALALAGSVAVLLGSATRITVTTDEFHAGQAHIPLGLLADPQALDAQATRTALGPDLDARTHVCLRGWVHTAVRVRVDDPADPTPFWIVSTRHPERLAEALDMRTPAASPGKRPASSDQHQ